MKRLLALILALVMTVSLVPADALAAQITTQTPLPEVEPKSAAPAWDGTVASGFARGDGTATFPYIIETPQQLAYFAQRVNNGQTDFHVHLAADINLGNISWTPIGNSEYYFEGVFRGNGFTISGLLINSNTTELQGLFGRFRGVASDINLSGSVSISSLSRSGACIGLFAGDNYFGTITNVNVSGSVAITTAADLSDVGGFCGTNHGLIIKCSSNITVSINAGGSAYAATTGGMIGHNYAELNSCYSAGSVSINTANGTAGGLCGQHTWGGTDVTFNDIIYNCYSTANVSTNSSREIYTGGLVGYSGGSVYIQDSYSTGSVSAVGSSAACAGGLVGYISGATISKCYAGASSISSTYSQVIEDSSAKAGRLIGYNNGGSVTGCIARSDTAITRTTYFDDGCDTGNTTTSSPSCSPEANTFTYGSDNPMPKLGWGAPWVSNGNNPILAHQQYVRCTVNYIIDGNVFCLATEYVPAGTAVNIVSPNVPYYTPMFEVIDSRISINCSTDVTYTRNSHSITVTCVDAQGNVIDVFAQPVEEGTSLTITAKTIPGYTPRQTSMTVEMGTTDIHTEWVYDVNSHPVTIYYKYLGSDAMAAETYTTTLNYGDSLQVASPAIVGYQVTNADDEVVTIDSMGDAPYEKTVYYVEQEQLAYTVVTMVGTTPLGGVTVTFNGEEKVTDIHGRAIFLYDQGTDTVKLQIHKDGYSSQTYEQAVDYRLKTLVGIDYFGMKINTADNPNYSVQGISCFGNDISTGSGIINVKYDGLIPIVIKASVPAEDKIKKILLVQEVDALTVDDSGNVVDDNGADHTVHKILRTVLPGDEALSSDGTCEFTMKGTEFAYTALEKRPIYVYLYAENATEPVIQRLNINTISLCTDIKFEGLFDKAECSLSGTGLPMLDGTKLSFEMEDKYKVEAPFSVEIINNEIYIGYDVTDAFKDEIQNMKDNKLFDKAKNMENRASKFMESMGKAVDSKFANNKWISSDTTTSFKIEAEAAGGMCFTVYEDGKVAAKSYAKVGISMNASWTTDFMIVVIPITVEAKVSLSGEITVTGLGLDFEHQEIIWPSTTVSLAANLRLSAGIGNRYASAGVFGNIKIGTELVLGETTYFDALILNGNGGFYAKLNLGLFKLYGEKSWTFLDKTIRLAPEGTLKSNSTDTSGYLGQFDGLPVYDISAYSLDTLSDTGEDPPSIPEWYIFDMQTVSEGILETSNPKLAEVNGSEVMVYFATASDRDIANAKQLVYRVKTADGTWSEETPVADDGTGDTDFDMTVFDGKLYLAYAHAKSTYSSADYTDTADLLMDMTFSQEITVAVFDPQAGTFQTLAQLTDDGFYDTLPTFGTVNNALYLTWNKNTALDDTATFCMNTENHIWYTSFDGTAWAEPACALRKCYPVVDLAVTGLAGKVNIALIVDEDASLYTEDDQNLYLTDLSGGLTLINCYGSSISRLQPVSYNGASLLLWHNGTGVMALADPHGAPFLFSGENFTVGEDFLYFTTAQQQSVMLWCEKDVTGYSQGSLASNVYIAVLNNQCGWGDPIRLASVPYHIMTMDGIFADDNLRLCAVDTYLSTPDSTGEQTLTSYSKLLYKTFSLPRQIRLDSHSTVTSRMMDLVVTVHLTNTGATTIDNVNLTLVDHVKEGDWLGLIFKYGDEIPKAATDYTKKYSLGTTSVNLAPGESGTYTFSMSIDNTMSMLRTEVLISFPGDVGASGGVTEVIPIDPTIQGVDLGVTGEYIIINETEFLSVRVDNFGKTTGSGTLKVFRQNEDGTEALVHAESVNDLMSSNIKYYLIRLKKDFFLQTAEDFRCVIVSDSDENPENDQTVILARKLEGESGTVRDLLVEAPEMSDHKVTFDIYKPSDISLSITMNEDILRYVGCVDMESNNVDHTLTESEDGKTLHITLNGQALAATSLGEQEIRFLFLTDLGYIDSIFLINVIDTTPIPLTGRIHVTDGSTPVQSAKRGMTLWLDTQLLNTEQVHVQWLIGNSVIGTSHSLVIEEQHLGKQLTVQVTGEAPYYGTIQTTVYIEKILRSLDMPIITGVACNEVTIGRIFHVGSDTLLYGFSMQNDPTTVAAWQESSTLILPTFGTYYLFTRAPGTEIYAETVSPAAVYEYICTHTDATAKPAQDPTCTEPGWNLYYVCNVCGQVLTADGAYTTAEEQQLPALGHDWTAKTEDAAHLKEPAADCVTCHTYWYGCSRCDAVSTTDFYEGSTYGDHSFENGSCTVCGEPDPDAIILTGKGFSLSFEDEILVNFYFSAQNTAGAQLGMLVFYEDPGTVEFTNANEVYTAAFNDASATYSCTTDGIPAKQMGDLRYYVAYAKRADGSFVYSPVYKYSPKNYALSRLENSTDEKMKALCVAMLNFGTAAQRYFNYRTDDLMNASLTQSQQALVVSYDASLFAGAIPADASKIGCFGKTDVGFSARSATVSFDGAFAINYYLKPDSHIEGDILFYYWNAADYAAADILTADNATGCIIMGDNNDGSYFARVTGIAAKQLDDTYYVAAVYNNADGTYCSGIIAYSLSRYCMNNAKDGQPMQDLAAATAVYGYHAKDYFTK